MSTRRAVRKALQAMLYAAALLVLASAAFVVLAPRATHGEALEVLTGSMRPTIQPGSLVFIRAVDPNELHPGDVATYQTHSGKSALVTHRIIAVHHDERGLTFTFKGDANSVADPDAVPAAALHGRVWLSVPYAGEMRALAGTRMGYVLLVLVPGLLYMIGQLRQGLRAARRPNRRPPLAAGDWPHEDPHILKAVFEGDPFEGLGAENAAALLRAAAVSMPDGTCALVLVADVRRVRQAKAVLDSFGPIRVESSRYAPFGPGSAALETEQLVGVGHV